MPNNKYKVGEIIVLVKIIKDLYPGGINCQGYRTDKELVGKIAKIIEYVEGKPYEDYPYKVIFDECPDSRVYNEREIRPATEDEIDKYYLLKYRD